MQLLTRINKNFDSFHNKSDQIAFSPAVITGGDWVPLRARTSMHACCLVSFCRRGHAGFGCDVAMVARRQLMAAMPLQAAKIHRKGSAGLWSHSSTQSIECIISKSASVYYLCTTFLAGKRAFTPYLLVMEAQASSWHHRVRHSLSLLASFCAGNE